MLPLLALNWCFCCCSWRDHDIFNSISKHSVNYFRFQNNNGGVTNSKNDDGGSRKYPLFQFFPVLTNSSLHFLPTEMAITLAGLEAVVSFGRNTLWTEQRTNRRRSVFTRVMTGINKFTVTVDWFHSGSVYNKLPDCRQHVSIMRLWLCSSFTSSHQQVRKETGNKNETART